MPYSYLLKNYKVLPYDVLNQLDFYSYWRIWITIPVTTNYRGCSCFTGMEFKCERGLAHTDLVKLSGKYENKGGIGLHT
jgi:DNA polymerase (family 10)/histidinol-phosphatase (PHP family)